MTAPARLLLALGLALAGAGCQHTPPSTAPRVAPAPASTSRYDPAHDLGPLFHDVQMAGLFPDSKTFVDARALAGALGDRPALRRRARAPRVRPARVRGRALRAAPTARGRGPGRYLELDGGAHPPAVAIAHPTGGRASTLFIASPAAPSVRGARRPVPRGVLLGLVLHHAGLDRERSGGSHAQHARQLRPPGRHRRSHPERQSDLLPRTQPTAVLRRDGRPVRAGRRQHARRCATSTPWRRSTRSGWTGRAGWRRERPTAAWSGCATARCSTATWTTSPSRGPSRTARTMRSPRRLPAERRTALYRNLRASAESGWDFSSRWMRDPKDLRTLETTELVPVDLNSLLYHAERTIAALRRLRRGAGDERGCRPIRRGGRESPARPAGRGVRPGQRLLLRRPLAHRRARDRSADAGRRGAALLRAGDAGAGSRRGGAARARLPQAGRLRHDAGPLRAAVGRAERLAAAGVARHRGGAAIRPRRHRRRRRARAGSRSTAARIASTGKMTEKYDVVDLNRRAGGGEYPDAGRLRLDQRRRARRSRRRSARRRCQDNLPRAPGRPLRRSTAGEGGGL